MSKILKINTRKLERELRKIEKKVKKYDNTTLNMQINLDEDEYGNVERQCPDASCRARFFIKVNDFEKLAKDSPVKCPVCNRVNHAEAFYTEEQIKDIEKKAMEKIMKNLKF